MKHSDIVAVTHNKNRIVFKENQQKCLSTHEKVGLFKFILWKYKFSKNFKDPHACEKKPILTGHQQAHAKQEKVFIVHFILLSERIQNFIILRFLPTYSVKLSWLLVVGSLYTKQINGKYFT